MEDKTSGLTHRCRHHHHLRAMDEWMSRWVDERMMHDLRRMKYLQTRRLGGCQPSDITVQESCHSPHARPSHTLPLPKTSHPHSLLLRLTNGDLKCKLLEHNVSNFKRRRLEEKIWIQYIFLRSDHRHSFTLWTRQGWTKARVPWNAAQGPPNVQDPTHRISYSLNLILLFLIPVWNHTTCHSLNRFSNVQTSVQLNLLFAELLWFVHLSTLFNHWWV